MQELKTPSNWSEITVKTYLNFLGSRDILQQIASLCNLDFDDEKIMRLTSSEVRRIKHSLKWMEELPQKTPNILELNGKTYFKKPLNTMCVFEWRTYDYYTREPDENYIAQLIATMYQLEGEKWGYDLNDRAREFLNAPMSYWGLVEWFNFKKICFEKYPLANDEVKAEIPENENYLQKAARLEKERQDKINSALNWESIMLDLSNNSALEAYNAMHLSILYIFRLITLKKES